MVMVGDDDPQSSARLPLGALKLAIWKCATRAASLSGRVDNVDAYLRAADAFVLPSATEGLPNSVLEAMACGLPSVMSDLPGISWDVIRSEEEGILLPERSAAALAAALGDLLTDEQRRRSIGGAARARILDRFSIESRVERNAALYAELTPQPLPAERGARCR